MKDSIEERSFETILAAVQEVENEAPGGAEALYMAAMLANSTLPYDFALSIEGTPHHPSLINPAAAFFAATTTIAPLVTRGLVKADPDSQIFALQEDVREALLSDMDDEQKIKWAGRAMYGLNLVLPDAEPGNWSMVEWLMPHVQACRDLVTELGVNTPAANRIFHQVGFSLHHQKRHHEAATLLDMALAVDVAVKGRQHPDIAADLEGLGVVLWDAGETDRAEAAFSACLDLQKEIYTEDNLVTAPILNSLAVIRQGQGRFEEAEETFKECLKVLGRAHGEGHPATASCLNNMALLYEAMNRFEDALRLAERSLEINRSFFGDAHPDVAADLNTVALLHESLGNGLAAEQNFRDSLSIREQAFGKEHPETAQAMCNLALLLDNRGRHDEAIAFYEQGLAAYEATLGADNPLVESALDNYIRLLEKTGKRPASDALREKTEAKLREIVQLGS